MGIGSVLMLITGSVVQVFATITGMDWFIIGSMVVATTALRIYTLELVLTGTDGSRIFHF